MRHRLDKLLRAAEQGAVEIREAAERRAAALLVQAHAELGVGDRGHDRAEDLAGRAGQQLGPVVVASMWTLDRS